MVRNKINPFTSELSSCVHVICHERTASLLPSTETAGSDFSSLLLEKPKKVLPYLMCHCAVQLE